MPAEIGISAAAFDVARSDRRTRRSISARSALQRPAARASDRRAGGALRRGEGRRLRSWSGPGRSPRARLAPVFRSAHVALATEGVELRDAGKSKGPILLFLSECPPDEVEDSRRSRPSTLTVYSTPRCVEAAEARVREQPRSPVPPIHLKDRHGHAPGRRRSDRPRRSRSPNGSSPKAIALDLEGGSSPTSRSPMSRTIRTPRSSSSGSLNAGRRAVLAAMPGIVRARLVHAANSASDDRRASRRPAFDLVRLRDLALTATSRAARLIADPFAHDGGFGGRRAPVRRCRSARA